MPYVPKGPVKSEQHAAAGRASAAKRWGPRRTVRLDSLTPDQRRLVLAMIAAVTALPPDDQSAA